MQQLADFRLYVITDRRQTSRRSVTEIISEICQAGVKAVQLREKDLSGRDLFRLAKDVQQVCSSSGTKLLVNDRCDVAQSVGAAGVHLTSKSLPGDVVRRYFPSLKLIGASTHSVEEARKAEQKGCDFIVFGPVFETPSKMAYGPPQGLAELLAVSKAVAIPVVAIGGITPSRAQDCLQHGAAGVAVISALMQAENISARIREFEDSLGGL